MMDAANRIANFVIVSSIGYDTVPSVPLMEKHEGWIILTRISTTSLRVS